jgi:hypothetical protein
MKNIFIYSLGLLFFCGCKKSSTSSIGNFPNTVGDTWTYQVNDTLYFQQILTAITQYNMTVTVTGSMQLPGGINAHVWAYESPLGNDTNYVFQKGDAICFAANNLPAVNVVKQYIVPFTLHQGWLYSYNSIHPVAVDMQGNITVGALFFENAFHIAGNPGRPDDLFALEEWFANGTGMVERYFNNTGFSTNPYQHRTRWSLLSYHVQ